MVSRGRKPPRDNTSLSFAQLVREALDRVASPEVRGDIIERALQHSGSPYVPGDIGRLTAFVEGPLFEIVEAELGPAAAAAVLEALRPAVDQARRETYIASGVHERVELASHLSLSGLTSERPAEPASVAPPSSAPLSRRTVLVATDDHELTQLAEEALRPAGYRVLTGPGGSLALALCVRHRPTLVLAAARPSPAAATELASLISLALGAEAPPVLLLADDPDAVAHPDVAAVLATPTNREELLAALEDFVDDDRRSSRPA
jgi:CheY-like chemotaxis protein